VKDSNSTISPWSQRDHAWSVDQHDNSDEVKYVNSTINNYSNYTDGMDLKPSSKADTADADKPAANASANASADANSTTPANATAADATAADANAADSANSTTLV
jgi:hypothetical protein